MVCKPSYSTACLQLLTFLAVSIPLLTIQADYVIQYTQSSIPRDAANAYAAGYIILIIVQVTRNDQRPREHRRLNAIHKFLFLLPVSLGSCAWQQPINLFRTADYHCCRRWPEHTFLCLLRSSNRKQQRTWLAGRQETSSPDTWRWKDHNGTQVFSGKSWGAPYL